MDRMVMKIDGMSCGHCVRAVENALAGLNGVTVEQVEVGQATVTYDRAVTTPDRIAKAIEGEGYTVAASRYSPRPRRHLVRATDSQGGTMQVKDPVCGMTIDSESAAGRSEFEGQTYHFCSAHCLKQFEQDPKRFVGTG